jgi:hypothetical protein
MTAIKFKIRLPSALFFGLLGMGTSSALGMVPMNLSTRYTSNENISDHRSDGIGSFSLSQFEFIFGLRAFNEQNYKAHLQVGLPMRTLKMAQGTSSQIGSEVGGYRVAWNQTLFEHIGWDLIYSKHSSPRLNLFSENSNIETLVSAKTMNFMMPTILIKALIGPGIRLTQSVDPNVNLQPMYIARAGFEAIWATEYTGKWAVGISGVFRNRSATLGANQSPISANLFTVQPQLAWEIVKDLWITANYTKALARPIGFEQAMGDAGLGGLYGDSIGIGISTASM